MSICTHTIRHGPLCAHCGQTIINDATMFCLLHNTDTLRTTFTEANKIARERKLVLDNEKKLILIIDLDHTLIHATYLVGGNENQWNMRVVFVDCENVNYSEDRIKTHFKVANNDNKLHVDGKMCDIMNNGQDYKAASRINTDSLESKMNRSGNCRDNLNEKMQNNFEFQNNERLITDNTKIMSNEISKNDVGFGIKNKNSCIDDLKDVEPRVKKLKIENDTTKDEIPENRHIQYKISNKDNLKPNLTENDIYSSKNIKSVVKNIHNEEVKFGNMDEKIINVNKKRKIVDNSKNKPIKTNEDVIYCFIINKIKHYIKIRPFCHELLEACNKTYEMHVYTMGSRSYANNVVKILDPTGKYFANRIITRDENMDQRVKTLDRLSSDHRNIVVLDDRGDIWDYCCNLVLVRPFHFFKCGDINSPEKMNHVQNDSSVYLNANCDIELKFINFILQKVYDVYFSTCRNVKKVMKQLRKNILTGKNFMIDSNSKIDRKSVEKIIRNCSGKMKDQNVDYIFALDLSESALCMQKRTGADIVSVSSLVGFYMYFKVFDFEKNMLKAVVDEELVKEFEDYLD